MQECNATTVDILSNLIQFVTGSGGTVDFEGVDPGHHTIRILAENSADDRATIRVRARVLKPGHCTVTLINQQWALEEGVLTVWFKGHPKQDSFDCKVADEFECHGKSIIMHFRQGS